MTRSSSRSSARPFSSTAPCAQVPKESALGEREAAAQVDAPNWTDDSPPRLAAVFVIERISKPNPEHEPEVIALSSAAAFQLLLYHAHCFSYDDEDRRRLMLERYLEPARAGLPDSQPPRRGATSGFPTQSRRRCVDGFRRVRGHS